MIHISRGWRIVAWSIYLVIAFTLTHSPADDVEFATDILGDVVLHAAGYAILGILSIWVAAAHRRPLTFRRVAAVYGLILVYALIDEWTQPWVGRSCELTDWLADAAGALVGVLAATAVIRRFAAESAASS